MNGRISSPAQERGFLSAIFVVIFALMAADIYEDMGAGASLTHVGIESFILILSIGGILILWLRYFEERRKSSGLVVDLAKAREDLRCYREETRGLSEGLAEQIDKQLERWQLTAAEKEIALLVLKGLRNSEIAQLRGTSEKTVRQQLTAVYEKSNLTNRSELSAFFLEDLLFAGRLPSA